jgi:hypothetical protein
VKLPFRGETLQNLNHDQVADNKASSGEPVQCVGPGGYPTLEVIDPNRRVDDDHFDRLYVDLTVAAHCGQVTFPMEFAAGRSYQLFLLGEPHHQLKTALDRFALGPSSGRSHSPLH